MAEQCWHRPEERSKDLWQVVEVSSNAPVPIIEQQRLAGSLFCLVFGFNEFSIAAPNLDLTVGLSKVMALAVTVVVDIDANCSRNKYSEGQRSTKVYGMFSEVEGVGSVNCGEESEAAPADVVASAVMLNIHRCEISRLPEEELVAVNKLQTHVDQHGVTHIPVPFILSK